MALATLSIDITAKIANIERDMGRAAQIAERNAKRMEQAFAGASKALGALGGVLSAGAFASMVKGVIDTGDALSKLSQRTGVAVEDLSKLQYAASLNDLTNDKLETSLAKLAKSMADTAAGTGDAAKAFAAMGISVTDSSGKLRSGAAVIADVADRFSQYEDGAAKAALAQQIFGRSGAEMIPLLNSGAKGLKEMGDEAARLGIVMSEDLAKKSAEFNDNMTRLHARLEGMKRDVIVPMIPVLLEMSEGFADSAREADGMSVAGEAMKTVLQTVAVVGANVAFVLKATGREIGGISAQMAALAQLDFKGFSAIGALMREDAEAARRALDEYEKRILGLSQSEKSAASTARRQAAPTLAPDSKEPRKTGKRAVERTDDLGEFLKDLEAAMKPAEDAMARFRDIQLDATIAGQGLTRAEQELFRLVNSPEWEAMPESRQELVRASFEAANATERVSDEQRRLNELIAATPTAQLERQRQTMQLLAQAFEDGRISAEQFGEAATTALGNIGESTRQTTDIMEEFTKQAARNMQDAFADFLFDPFKDGLDGMLQSFGRMLQRMIAEAIAADLANKILGPSGNGKGGWLDLAFTAASAYFGAPTAGTSPANISRGGSFSPSFEGGGFTGIGSRSGGIDGRGGFPAILHPNETVIDHTKGGRTGQVINMTINVASGTPQEVRRAAGAGAREALGAFARAQRYS